MVLNQGLQEPIIFLLEDVVGEHGLLAWTLRNLMLHQAPVIFLNNAKAISAWKCLDLSLKCNGRHTLQLFFKWIHFFRGVKWTSTEVDELFENVLYLILENDNFTWENFSVGCIFCQEIVETICVETGVCSKSAKPLLLDNQLIQFGLVVLNDFLVWRHLLSPLSDALSLETGLFINLTNFHENHGGWEEVQFLADEQSS